MELILTVICFQFVYSTQTPLLFVTGSCGLYVHKGKTIEFMPELTRYYGSIDMPHPTPFRYRFTAHFF